MSVAVIVLLVIVVVGLLTTAMASVKIIKEYQRIVLFRLGRSIGSKGPGFMMINPVVDRVRWVDLREQYLEIPHQVAITEDNASIAIDFIIFYKVFDPVSSVVAVADFQGAALNIASTTLRSVVGDLTLDDVLSKREEMNSVLRVKLDDVTERWGVKVTNVEVREINPPPGVQEAMIRQMSAERTRRAVVTEAEGQKSASITVAEGGKQSAILAAEGQRQAAILNAEAQKQSAILAAEGERQAFSVRAEGIAAGLKRISETAHAVDHNTMTLQYFEALKQIGASSSTKWILPMEVSRLLAGIEGPLQRALGAAEGHQDGDVAGEDESAQNGQIKPAV